MRWWIFDGKDVGELFFKLYKDENQRTLKTGFYTENNREK